MKKVISFMLSLVMLVSISAGISFTVSADSSGDFEYTVLDDGTAEIINYTGSATEVTIPSEIDGYTVTSIYKVFYYNDIVNSVLVSDGIENISYSTFAYCEKLESIVIPKSVTNIESTAIIYCPSLEQIVVDSSNSVYDSRNNCNAIIETDSNILITGCINTIIPDGIVRIESDAFNGCKGLKSISIPETVESIGSFAFHQTGLTSVFIPYSVEKIETSYGTYHYPFYECSSLEEIIVDKNNPNYSSLDGVLFNKSKTQLLNYPDGKKDETYIIPDTVSQLSNNTEYAYYPFYNCAYLKNIIFPENVTFIDRTTTSYLMNLNVTILNPNCELYGYNTDGEISLAGVEKIFGFENSTAQQYAENIGVEFVLLDKPEGEGIVSENTDKTYIVGSEIETSIYCSYDLADFVSVAMDGETVDPSNYTLAAGSTLLTFKPAYLDTLSVGNHTVALNYTNATVTSVLTIKAASDNPTVVPEEPTTGKDEQTTNNTETDKTTGSNHVTGSAVNSTANVSSKSPDTGASYAGIAAAAGAAVLSGVALIFLKKKK